MFDFEHERLVGKLSDDKRRDSEWPAEDPKGFFFIGPNDDTE